MKKVFKFNSLFLISKHPCSDGLAWFENEFPDGVTLTNDQQEMFELCERVLDNAEDTRDSSASFLEWLCFDMKSRNTLFSDYVYFGSNPYGKSYGKNNYTDSIELYSLEPEHCALIICSFVDKFGKTNVSNRVRSTK